LRGPAFLEEPEYAFEKTKNIARKIYPELKNSSHVEVKIKKPSYLKYK